MSAARLLIGLAASSDAAEAVLIRTAGVGLSAAPTVEASARHAALPHNRDVADAAVTAIRQLTTRAGVDLGSVLAVGLIGNDALAEPIADRTGLTVVSGFAARDIAAGGRGRPIGAAADYLLYHSPTEDRVLIHLGPVVEVLTIPSRGTLTDVTGYEAGPGTALLDAIVRHGSRGKDQFDAGGTRAVQGKCLDSLLTTWLAHPFYQKKPPKVLPAGLSDNGFLTAAFDAARDAGGSLFDLLCTATHLIARGVVLPPTGLRGVFVSGGGVKNGFLWQRLQQQFPGEPIRPLDELGVPAGMRTAAAVGVLAGLTLDGVTGNLPLLTGAAGGRFIGRLTPGDPRNWAAVTAWAAGQMMDYLEMSRAA